MWFIRLLIINGIILKMFEMIIVLYLWIYLDRKLFWREILWWENFKVDEV